MLGLTVLSVRKTGLAVVEKVRAANRLDRYGTSLQTIPVGDDIDPALRDADHWNVLFIEMREQNLALQKQLESAIQWMISEQTDVRALTSSNNRLSAVLEERNAIDATIKRILGEGAHWSDTLTQLKDHAAMLRVDQVAATTKIVDAVGTLSAQSLKFSEAYTDLNQSTLNALNQQTMEIQKISDIMNSKENSNKIYNDTFLNSLLSHQLSISQGNEHLRTLVAKLIDQR
jgi:hypothetical protein